MPPHRRVIIETESSHELQRRGLRRSYQHDGGIHIHDADNLFENYFERTGQVDTGHNSRVNRTKGGQPGDMVSRFFLGQFARRDIGEHTQSTHILPLVVNKGGA